MDKQHILEEIRRTASANKGRPLGRQKFFRATGIREYDWYGKFWARWSDAVSEAGFKHNHMQDAYAESWLIEKFIELSRELGKFPAQGDLLMKSRNDDEFPNPKTFCRLGLKTQRASKIADYCRTHEGYDDVLRLCMPLIGGGESLTEDSTKGPEEIGFVYLLKSGRYYKVGRSNSVGRRERELAIQLPEKTVMTHVIKTDDPAGIEAYWHKRFVAKRKNGEWFELDSSEVKAFKRRKFM